MASDRDWPSYMVDCTITLTQSRLRLRGNERELICYRYPILASAGTDTSKEPGAAPGAATSVSNSDGIVASPETAPPAAGDKSYLILQRAGTFVDFSLWQMRSAYILIHRSGVVVPAVFRSAVSAGKAIEHLHGALPQGDEHQIRVQLNAFLIDEDILTRQFQRIPRFRYTVTNFQSD